MNSLTYGAVALAAYLLGSIPFGFLIAKSRRIDIRSVGSGNIGATNVFRAVGKFWGIVTLLLDAAKGFAAVYWLPERMVRLLADPGHETAGESPATLLLLLSALMVIVGHNWTVFLRFRGGKGVATSIGVLLGLAPLVSLAALAVWSLTLLLTRYVSLASILAAAVTALLAWPLYLHDGGPLLPGALTLLALLAITRHHANIRRLLAGTENRIGRRPEGR